MTAAAEPVAPAERDYEEEIRFGVVMYGGVSLAIYINGVSNELFELARATPRLQFEETPSADSTGECYRRLSLLAANPDLRRQYAHALAVRTNPEKDVWCEPAATAAPARTRFIIDVISGTSAGGINGIFLAKALVNDEDFGRLATLWINEGDIGKLLNDSKAYDGLSIARPADPPKSLLSSDRMYLKLMDALGQMQALHTPKLAESPYAEELDLFVTTTDILGSPVSLRLFDQTVQEMRYKQRFHFTYPSQVQPAGAGKAWDFAPENKAFLAFAARCTSSFPFAFEPMKLARTSAIAGNARADDYARWKPFFDNLPEAGNGQPGFAERPFGDGGYLDNKPFSYVCQTLSQRFGNPPAQRKLLYVEPDPETPAPPEPEALNAVTNALDALLAIPRYETIREDLQSILRRNRRIDRVETIVLHAEQDIEKSGNHFDAVVCVNGQVPRWTELTQQQMVRFHGQAFLSYRRLRVYDTTDWLARVVAAHWAVDEESDKWQGLRALVRSWRRSQFSEDPDDIGDPPKKGTYNAFLDRFDLEYKVRRLSFLLRRIDQFTRLLRGMAMAERPPPTELEALMLDKWVRLGSLPTQAPAAAGGPVERWTTRLLDKREEVTLELVHIKRALRGQYRQLIDIRRRLLRGEHVPCAGDALPAPQPVGQDILQAVHAHLDKLVFDGDEPDPSAPIAGVRPQDVQSIIEARAEAMMNDASANGAQLRGWLDSAVDKARVAKLGNSETAASQVLTALFENDLGRPRLEPAVAGEGAQLWVGPLPTLSRARFDAKQTLLRWLGEYVLTFDSFDQARFPLFYDTDTGEAVPVEVIRVSPVDAKSLRSATPDMPKLAGNSFAHFGGFLDERWRRNDMMWGRLDGAERIIGAVLPGDDAPTAAVRKELVTRAHDSVLRELARDSKTDLTQTMMSALGAAAAGPAPADKLTAVLSELDANPAKARERLSDMLSGLLTPPALRQFLKDRLSFDPRVPVADTLNNASRAVNIAGGMLQDISQTKPPAKPVARWLLRLGMVLQGVVAVSLPSTLGERWTRLMMPTLYALEVLLVLVAFLFSSTSLLGPAWLALGLTAGLHLVKTVVFDWARGKSWAKYVMRAASGLRWFAVLLLIAVIGASIFGGLAAWHHGLRAVCSADHASCLEDAFSNWFGNKAKAP